MASLCQSQHRCVKASIVSSWRLAEAQDQLCSLGVHSSESLEQERARTLACPTELKHTEEEWRRKESMLGCLDPSRSPVLGAVRSWEVFDKVSKRISKEQIYRGVFYYYLSVYLLFINHLITLSAVNQCRLTLPEYHQCHKSICRNGEGQVQDLSPKV